MDIFLVLIFITCFVVAIVFLYLQKKSLANKRQIIQEQREKLECLRIENAKIIEKLNSKDNLGGLLESNFKNIATQILEQKNESLVKHNKQQIESLLSPLNQNIAEFKSQFRTSQDKTIEAKTHLQNELLQLKNLNQTIGTEAKKLTETLQGNKQQQGAWGEMILERVLEYSGLVKGREYTSQKESKIITQNSQQRLRPDIIIHLPAGKKIIIDSKVSLVHYNKFIHSEDELQKEKEKKAQLEAIKNHIKELGHKRYEDIFDSSLESVVMFIPIEPAFALILAEPTIHQLAFKLGIIPLSPTSLMGFLKIVHNIWNLERQDENAKKIVIEASRMYEKFVDFLKNFQDIGKALDNSKKSYDKAHSQLSQGRGNLTSKLKNLENLGIKAKKQLATNENTQS